MKYILKKTMEKHLPVTVLSHKKQGFTVPLRLWFKDSLREYVHDRLVAPGSRIAEYVNMDYVRKIANDNETGMRATHQKIWTLLVLDAWLERNHAQ